MAVIVPTHLSSQDITNTSAANSYANGSWTPAANTAVLVFVSSTISPGTGTTPSISGNSLTWTQVATVVTGAANTHTRITAFLASTVGATAGATTISFAGVTQRDCQAAFLQLDNTTIALGVTYTVVQAVTGSGTGTTLTLTSAAAANTNNAAIAGWTETFDTSNTTRSGWTNYYNYGAVNVNEIVSCDYKVDSFDTTASAGNSDVASGSWGGIALEIRANVGSPTMFFK